MKLTEKRAEVLKEQLKKEGVQGRIEVDPHGEAPQPRGPTRMALDRPEATTKENSDDDPADRVAVVQAVYSIDFEGEPPVPLSAQEGRELDQAIASGKSTWTNLVEPIIEEVRNIHKVQNNPFGESPLPSADKFEERLRQWADELADALSDPKSKIVQEMIESILATTFEGVVREKWKAEAALKRTPVYDAFGDGAAGALDSEYKRETFSDPIKQHASDVGYKAFSNLSETDKQNVTQYLVETARTMRDSQFGVKRSADWVAEHSTGSDIRYAAHLWFQWDNRQRD
jgi:hypothetical protein